MRNSDYEEQLALLSMVINELHANCYVGVLALHVLPWACAIGGLE